METADCSRAAFDDPRCANAVIRLRYRGIQNHASTGLISAFTDTGAEEERSVLTTCQAVARADNVNSQCDDAMMQMRKRVRVDGRHVPVHGEFADVFVDKFILAKSCSAFYKMFIAEGQRAVPCGIMSVAVAGLPAGSSGSPATDQNGQDRKRKRRGNEEVDSESVEVAHGEQPADRNTGMGNKQLPVYELLVESELVGREFLRTLYSGKLPDAALQPTSGDLVARLMLAAEMFGAPFVASLCARRLQTLVMASAHTLVMLLENFSQGLNEVVAEN